MNKMIPSTFECEPYGDFEKITPLISKGRLRIYHLGENRNHSYITQDFSDILETYLPYVPIVGIYNEYEKDFRGHSKDRNEANTYGLVPENPNTAWEDFTESDGTVKQYLCCDVYLYTGRYDAAKEIIGKRHSMELNRDSIEGYWKVINGIDYFVYTNGFFDGLCVLGNRVEPCFPGSAFFEKKDSIIEILEEYVKNKNEIAVFSANEGGRMDTIKKSNVEEMDSPAAEEVVEELTEVTEENPTEEPNSEESVESTDDMSDDDAPADSEEICPGCGMPMSQCKCDSACGDVKKEDAACGDRKEDSELTIEELIKRFPVVEPFIQDFISKNLELSNQINTYSLEIKTLSAELEETKAICEQYRLAEEKVLDEKKDQILAEYQSLISKEVFDSFYNNKSKYSLDELEKNLLFAFKQEKPEFFKRSEEPVAFSSLKQQEETGIAGILKKYKTTHSN